MKLILFSHFKATYSGNNEDTQAWNIQSRKLIATFVLPSSFFYYTHLLQLASIYAQTPQHDQHCKFWPCRTPVIYLWCHGVQLTLQDRYFVPSTITLCQKFLLQLFFELEFTLILQCIRFHANLGEEYPMPVPKFKFCFALYLQITCTGKVNFISIFSLQVSTYKLGQNRIW